MQYNAIMLVRILADNPGRSFTQNLDSKFVITTKELLRDGRDMSVQQILRETLDAFETQKAGDDTLKPLMTMWANEKAKYVKKGTGVSTLPYLQSLLFRLLIRLQVLPPPRPLNAPPYNPNQQYNQQQNYFSRDHRPARGLPPPHELASRIEEAKTSAKLLLQVVQTTPQAEVHGNDLLKEFADRCQSASRSIQGYINSDNPPPDEDTLLTLIETSDQLTLALSRHQRALLQARRNMGAPSPPISTPPIPPRDNVSPYAIPPPGPPPPRNGVSPGIQPPPGPPPQNYFPPVVPPAGPPPRLGMPYRQEKPENPFDDTPQSQGFPSPISPATNGMVSATSGPVPSLFHDDLVSPQTGNYHPTYTQTYGHRQQPSGSIRRGHDVDEEEPDSPEEGRRPVNYRF